MAGLLLGVRPGPHQVLCGSPGLEGTLTSLVLTEKEACVQGAFEMDMGEASLGS